MLTKLIAAAALATVSVAGAATPVAAAPASGASVMAIAAAAPAAQRWGHNDRRWDRGRHYSRGHYNRGRHYRYHNVRRCWTTWRHHHRVRVCR